MRVSSINKGHFIENNGVFFLKKRTLNTYIIHLIHSEKDIIPGDITEQLILLIPQL